MSAAPDDLVKFLRDQLDEDWQRMCDARRWSDRDWHVLRDERGDVTLMDESDVLAYLALDGAPGQALANHMARWDPAHVRRDIDSKRRIIDRYEAAEEQRADDEWDAANGGVAAGLYQALLDLAAVYEDRPGYHAEWSPAGI